MKRIAVALLLVAAQPAHAAVSVSTKVTQTGQANVVVSDTRDSSASVAQSMASASASIPDGTLALSYSQSATPVRGGLAYTIGSGSASATSIFEWAVTGAADDTVTPITFTYVLTSNGYSYSDGSIRILNDSVVLFERNLSADSLGLRTTTRESFVYDAVGSSGFLRVETGITGGARNVGAGGNTGSASTRLSVSAAPNVQCRFDDYPLGASAVPEPAIWSMMLIGFGMIGGAVRHRRQRTLVTSV